MSTVDDYILAEELIPGGGSVFLLNIRAEITAEDSAMLQALHSRSIGGIKGHLKRWLMAGSGNFMKNFYVGYGHKSIGDCGTTTLFVEGVSMLAAKAIQDWQLYCGQEASTRYIDFATQPFLNPLLEEAGERVQQRWRGLYVHGLPLVEEHVAKTNPMHPDENEGVYRKAVKARAFDVMRSILPAGATTNLAWHTNIRQAADKLDWLRHHPLFEAREIACAIEKVLMRGHPNSFSDKRYPASEEYRQEFMGTEYLYDPPHGSITPIIVHDGVDHSLLKRSWRHTMESRPPHTELPKQIGETGSLRFEFRLDYGSFRDLQRHRSVVQRMPLLTTKLGFHPWYLESMPVAVRWGIESALSSFEEQMEYWRYDGYSPAALQYYVPMGYQVPISMTGDLAAMTYIVERRAPSDVHPTLQERAIQMAAELKRKYGKYGLVLHVDPMDLGRFTTKRGTADITERVEA